MNRIPSFQPEVCMSASPLSDPDALSGTQAVEAAAPDWSPLHAKLQPLVDGGRFDNIVDLLSVVSDLVDFADPALVEKLSKTFEEIVAASATAGGALRIASAEARRQPDAPSLRALWATARDPDTRRGIGIVLRTLQIVGRLHADERASAR
ncbi:hypothetical protein BDAG_01797 [Burkholderia dolosa AU0158]|nr:hypothetical protein BDAG_01797 [Burkholderia dolosa AU0158]